MNRERMVDRVRAWLQLLRAPNLFTVPGDPVAGCFLAAQSPALPWAAMGWVVAAALGFYGAGLAWNDYFDRHEDRRARPDRPLPSGRIRPGTALGAGWVLTIIGLLICAHVGLATFWTGLALAACVFGYNAWFKSLPVPGNIAMGACRGLSLLLGASAVPEISLLAAPVPLAAAIVFLYIAAVTHLARRETESHRPGVAAWGPLIVLIGGGASYLPYMPDMPWPRLAFLGVYTLACVVAFLFSLRMRASAKASLRAGELPGWIGRLIANLLFLHAALVLSANRGLVGASVAGMLVLCWACNRLVARRFYAS